MELRTIKASVRDGEVKKGDRVMYKHSETLGTVLVVEQTKCVVRWDDLVFYVQGWFNHTVEEEVYKVIEENE